ncbi:MAG: tetratricopeptide repeat protein [FCB group bacterium]|nr:tetratricopeptide repeat protein [FCB group bacterium]
MKISKSFNYALTITVSLLFATGLVPAQAEPGKIPITTSSEEAMKFFLQGRDLGEKLRFLESRKYYQKAVEADTTFALAYLNLSFTLPTVKGFFETFDKALALVENVSDGEQMMIRAIEVGIGGEAEKQLEIYKKLVAAYPKDERAHNLLGNSFFGRQDYEAAIAQYEKALSINSEFSQPYNQLGYSYRFLNKYAEAETAFKKYIKLIPDDPNPYDSYAELLMKMGKYEESIEYYRKALGITPVFFNSHIGIASDFNFLGQHEKAREQLQKFYAVAADVGQRRVALQAKAISYADEGNMDKALSELKKQYTLAKNSDDYPAMAGDMNLMANIMLELNNTDQALEFFKKSMKLTEQALVSNEVKANARRGFMFNSARVAIKQGNLEEAKVLSKKFHKAVEKIGNTFQDRQAHALAGMIAYVEGDFGKAIAQYEQSNLQNPYNLFRMALAFKKNGDTEKAKDYCKQAAEHNTLNSFNYSFIRQKAKDMLSSI